jgi:paraquat-inducible protein B
MSKQANKTIIGGFVLGAMALIVAAVLIFGSGRLLSTRVTFVMFFQGSVKGLQIGAPVVFRGVKIGQVSDIAMRVNPDDLSVLIAVYVEIETKIIMPSSLIREWKPYQYYNALIERGLKARLELQSFVTGQLMIGLDFYPDKQIKLVGIDKKYREIPTIPTTMDELAKTIQQLPLKELVGKLNSVVGGVDKLVNSSELHASFGSLNQTLKDIDKLAIDIDIQLEPLISSMKSASKAAHGAFTQVEQTLAFKKGVAGQLAESLISALTSASATLKEAQRALMDVKDLASQGAQISYEIGKALKQVTALSRSLTSLADYIERHPEALIRGKNLPREE